MNRSTGDVKSWVVGGNIQADLPLLGSSFVPTGIVKEWTYQTNNTTPATGSDTFIKSYQTAYSTPQNSQFDGTVAYYSTQGQLNNMTVSFILSSEGSGLF
jgi:hypothetical protein